MARARGGRVAAGLLLASVGATALWIGIAQPAFAGDMATSYPMRNVVVGGGVGIVGGGILVILLSFGARDAVPDIIPAEVAFVQPAVPRALPPVAPRAAPMPRPAISPPIPAEPQELPSPEQIALKRITNEIGELTRAINKAGVMLATGQISSQGYAQYVDELKQQRGLLEKDRVQLEMRRHKLVP